MNPTFTKSWYNKGNILYSMEKYETAIECYSKDVEINSNHNLAYFSIGLSFYKLDNYYAALDNFAKVETKLL